MAYVSRHGSVIVQDGGGTDRFTFDDVGDFSIDGLQEGGRAAVAIFNRMAFAGYVEGQDAELTGSFSVRVKREKFTDPSSGRPLDFVLVNGSAAGYSSDNQISGGPHAWRIKYTLNDGTTTTTLTIRRVRLTCSVAESGETVMMAINFTGYATPAVA